MFKKQREKAISTELTGGTGFTYEDTAVAYFLASLLREEGAAGISGVVKSVAVQRSGHGQPMDDIIVEFDESGVLRRIDLQAKQTLIISAAQTNRDFRAIISMALETRGTSDFDATLNAYGFVTENVAINRFRDLNRLIRWAKSSPDVADFNQRFAPGGPASKTARSLRDDLRTLIGVQTSDDERNFYAQFVAIKLDGLTEGGVLRAEIINRLQELVATNSDGQSLLLFDRLCRIAREGAGTSCKWTRQSLLTELRGAVILNVTPNYQNDIDRIQEFSHAGMAQVLEDVDGFHVERPGLKEEIKDRLLKSRLISLSGLPGCGKSAMLKSVASDYATNGPILFLKSDRLEEGNWLTFATSIGLQHHAVEDILTELGSTGTPILFIDGIDRVRPDQKGIIIDIVNALEKNEHLSDWKVMASSRDQGLEAYRAWFPGSFSVSKGIGEVSVPSFSDDEAEILAKEKPGLRRLLFGPRGVKEIARRPFFAAVLARSFPDDSATPQTEIDLISAWWERAGHDTPQETVPQRQRALLDLAEKGVRNLGKGISSRNLNDLTIEQVAGLKADFIIRDQDGGSPYSFTHDIFFEWTFFRQLIELGDQWTDGLLEAGEPPLLGRVVGLLAQREFSIPGNWTRCYRGLETKQLRPQWQREWLTSSPFSPTFSRGQQEFEDLLSENDFALLEKLLVWFQSQHTIPNPVVLQNDSAKMDGQLRIALADHLGWPSDGPGWGRLIDWLLAIAQRLPVRLLASAIEVLGVWQNVFADFKNPRSESIITICEEWLVELETAGERSHKDRGRWSEFGSEELASVTKKLRSMILRAGRAYPESAIELFKRATTAQRKGRTTYSDLMGYSSIMAEVAPEFLVELAKEELIQELPLDKLERKNRENRERLDAIKHISDIPEEERTLGQKLAYQPLPTLIRGLNPPREDDIGIDNLNNYYFPASPLHEPFGSLFEKQPETALGLVRDLANHATTGWRQVNQFHRDHCGTPIPLVLEFPWGRQEFWGDGHVYKWFLGQLGPNPLQCAFLALSYWAFKQIESGRSTSEVIKDIVEGHQCYAVLGLACLLALETQEVSEITFPLVTCQRLWYDDIARRVQGPPQDYDLYPLPLSMRLRDDQKQAKEYLANRESHNREIRQLALSFALTSDEGLRTRFKEALANFPNDLPHVVEETRNDPEAIASLKETAELWAGLGDSQNYRAHQTPTDEMLISYKSPKEPTPEQEKRLEASTKHIQEHNLLYWAEKSLKESELLDIYSLTDAVNIARAHDNSNIFDQRKDIGEHLFQSIVAAVAAVVIRFGSGSGADNDWAWDVMGRVFATREPDDIYSRSVNPWHPANFLIASLGHDRRSNAPREDSVDHLLLLTDHPNEGVAKLAFEVLFSDPDVYVTWIAAQLAMDLSLHHRVVYKGNGIKDDSENQEARKQSLVNASNNFKKKDATPLTPLPPAWIKRVVKPDDEREALDDHPIKSDDPSAESSSLGWPQILRRPPGFDDGKRVGWHDPNPTFDFYFAREIIPLFPVEDWCQSSRYKPLLAKWLGELVTWTAERLMLSQSESELNENVRRGRTDLIRWNPVLGDLISRAAPYFESDLVREAFLAPFLTDTEVGISVLASFADMTMARHVCDAPSIPANTFILLDVCAERLIRDTVFDPDGYRAGEVRGSDLPRLIKALLFVGPDGSALASNRFANGDWSEINIIMPTVTKVVTQIGWAPYVMQCFLTLCEQAGTAYPLEPFNEQTNAVLDILPNARVNWVGTGIPARIAGMVQLLADANYPLDADQAQKLLRVLDVLIDLGDRRSAALEQSEAFRGIQLH